MSYNTIADLPEEIRETLPQDASKIYQAAFNAAWEQYQLRKYRDNDTREETADRIAWSAVKAKYEQTEKGWKEI